VQLCLRLVYLAFKAAWLGGQAAELHVLWLPHVPCCMLIFAEFLVNGHITLCWECVVSWLVCQA
jgi:hypothetical protein